MLAHAQSLSRQLVALQRLLLLLQILYLLYKPFVFRFTVLPVLFQIYDSDLDQSFPDFSLYRFNLLVKLSGRLAASPSDQIGIFFNRIKQSHMPNPPTVFQTRRLKARCQRC